jgi:hypothetical protein
VFISSSKGRTSTVCTTKPKISIRYSFFQKDLTTKDFCNMATTKKQAFDIPFIGYDYGKISIGILMFFSDSMETYYRN